MLHLPVFLPLILHIKVVTDFILKVLIELSYIIINPLTITAFLDLLNIVIHILSSLYELQFHQLKLLTLS